MVVAVPVCMCFISSVATRARRCVVVHVVSVVVCGCARRVFSFVPVCGVVVCGFIVHCRVCLSHGALRNVFASRVHLCVCVSLSLSLYLSLSVLVCILHVCCVCVCACMCV